MERFEIKNTCPLCGRTHLNDDEMVCDDLGNIICKNCAVEEPALTIHDFGLYYLNSR